MKLIGSYSSCIVAFALSALLATTAAAVTLTEADDFEDGTVEDWAEGGASPNPPTNVASGGPAGADDNYLENISSGAAGPGGRMVMFNRAQWSGDYTALGAIVTLFTDAANFGPSALDLRIGIAANDGIDHRWVSTTSQTLPADGQWYAFAFELSPAAMTQVEGSLSLDDVLANAVELRIFSAAGVQFQGDLIDGTMGIDNFRVGNVLQPIFADGFESGDIQAWD